MSTLNVLIKYVTLFALTMNNMIRIYQDRVYHILDNSCINCIVPMNVEVGYVKKFPSIPLASFDLIYIICPNGLLEYRISIQTIRKPSLTKFHTPTISFYCCVRPTCFVQSFKMIWQLRQTVWTNDVLFVIRVWHELGRGIPYCKMMTSSNGNIFRVTVPLCG